MTNKINFDMSTTKFNTVMLSLLLLISVSCSDNIEEPAPQTKILPEKFTVAIPPSLTSAATNGRTLNGRIANDELNGNEIYELLGAFIKIGEFSGQVMEALLQAISEFGINKTTFISYQSDEDGRTKNLQVVENVTFEGVNYEFQLTITDAESENNSDGGKAMQVFWNTSPVKGVAILKPFNIDRVKDADAGDVLYRIDYSEETFQGYEAHMIVSITNLPLADPTVDPFSINNLKMFVGKNGEIVDVYGNSNHPNAKFFTEDTGFGWAFVASGIDNQDIGVAEVGLPSNTLNSNSRSTLLIDNAIKKIFSDQISAAFPNIEQAELDRLLANTEAPGFFNESGFIQGGTSPGTQFDPLVTRLQDLTPYNPNDINGLQITFK